MTDKITKVDIFSGFLGAGKTTLIRKLIEEAYEGEKLVLIENEFGEIGIDGGFLKDAGIEINEMNSGCICCTLVGDFSKAIEKVIKEFEPDRILIEPSGVGKLSDVILAVENLKDDRIKLNSFTTIVDGRRYKMYMKNFGEFYNNQVEHANTVIVSHAQDMDREQIDAAVSMIRTLNTKAGIITTDWDSLGGKKILETMEEGSTLESALDKLAYEVRHEGCDHEHGVCNCSDDHEEHNHEHEQHHEHCREHEPHDHNHHEHEHDHDHEQHHGHHDHEHHHNHHGHHHADEVFDSVGIETTRRYSEAELGTILEQLENDHGLGVILRAKGILEGDNGWLHFDLVPGDFEIRHGSPEVIGRIVAIGTDLDKDKIKEIFKIS